MSLITSATTYDYESVSYLHEEKQRMFVWGRNIYLVQLLSAATPGMTSPVRKRVPVGQICNRLQAQMDSETGSTSTPLSPNPYHEQFVLCNSNWMESLFIIIHLGHEITTSLVHAKTAHLSCHIQNFIAVTVLTLGWEQVDVSNLNYGVILFGKWASGPGWASVHITCQ